METTDSTRRGLNAVLLSIVVAGILGYAIQLSAPALTDAATYLGFSVFWSAIYLGGSAMAGIQQEISRAVHPGHDLHSGRALRAFLLGSALLVLLIAIVVVVLSGDVLFAGHKIDFGAALCFGLVGYLCTSVLTGVLYGIRLWSAVAFVAILDAVIRAVLVVGALVMGAPLGTLVIFIAAPFLLASAITYLVYRRRLRHAFRLDVSLRVLAWQAAGTVVAAGSAGLLISGMPMLIGLLAPTAAPSDTAALILTITVTRAPIVIPIIALQSFLISAVLRGRARPTARQLLSASAVAVVVTAVLAVIAWFIGPGIIGLISTGKYEISSMTAAVVVASAVLVAWMSLLGPMLVSQRRHAANATAWVFAATLTVVFLAMLPERWAIPFALVVAPAVGVAFTMLALLRPAREMSH
ncbi:hypothetical protein [Microbacterium sp. RG1]|uniref:hypothetical protein n=1 Tax=Microbacterium sp. RG1 TaxID=2489212 RepID=UPI0010CA41D1|nr:hypothetical protein [Microbacterium sp. RG1]QCQ15392.1 hypothetical protein EHF32_00850 [Microbacterium sp. RG1]